MSNHTSVAINRHRRIWLGEMLDSIAPPSVVNVGLLERLLSLAVGATLLLVTVRRFVLYFGMTAAGSYLLYRGVTGYCPFYADERIDTRNWGRKLLVFEREQQNEQGNYARKTATSSGQSESDVGQDHRQ